jgi:hypothetical protein
MDKAKIHGRRRLSVIPREAECIAHRASQNPTLDWLTLKNRYHNRKIVLSCRNVASGETAADGEELLAAVFAIVHVGALEFAEAA